MVAAGKTSPKVSPWARFFRSRSILSWIQSEHPTLVGDNLGGVSVPLDLADIRPLDMTRLAIAARNHYDTGVVAVDVVAVLELE